MFFSHLPKTEVLLRMRGGFTTAPLYERNGYVYAKLGRSFHEMTANNTVSGTKYSWVEFSGDHAHRISLTSLSVVISSEEQPRIALAA